MLSLRRINRQQRIDFRSPPADWAPAHRFSGSPFPNRRTFTPLLTWRDLSWRNYGEVLSRPESRIRKGSRQQLLPFIKNTTIRCFRLGGLRSQATRRQYLPRMCRCGPGGLPGHGQSETFPKTLEETKIITPPEFSGLIVPSSNQVASASRVSPLSPLGYLGNR
jgi:hypothetical protein